MQTTEFFKVYGVQERQDQLIRLAANNYLLIVGFGQDEASENGYSWRKYYDHKPTEIEIRADVADLVNPIIDAKILSGFRWNNKPVWLSTENQFNYKAAYDLAVQTQGTNLPIKFKLGEDETGAPVYHTFTKIESFADFILKAFDYINTTLKEGWTEKDSVQYADLIANAE